MQICVSLVHRFRCLDAEASRQRRSDQEACCVPGQTEFAALRSLASRAVLTSRGGWRPRRRRSNSRVVVISGARGRRRRRRSHHLWKAAPAGRRGAPTVAGRGRVTPTRRRQAQHRIGSAKKGGAVRSKPRRTKTERGAGGSSNDQHELAGTASTGLATTRWTVARVFEPVPRSWPRRSDVRRPRSRRTKQEITMAARPSRPRRPAHRPDSKAARWVSAARPTAMKVTVKGRDQAAARAGVSVSTEPAGSRHRGLHRSLRARSVAVDSARWTPFTTTYRQDRRRRRSVLPPSVDPRNSRRRSRAAERSGLHSPTDATRNHLRSSRHQGSCAGRTTSRRADCVRATRSSHERTAETASDRVEPPPPGPATVS